MRPRISIWGCVRPSVSLYVSRLVGPSVTSSFSSVNFIRNHRITYPKASRGPSIPPPALPPPAPPPPPPPSPNRTHRCSYWNLFSWKRPRFISCIFIWTDTKYIDTCFKRKQNFFHVFFLCHHILKSRFVPKPGALEIEGETEGSKNWEWIQRFTWETGKKDWQVRLTIEDDLRETDSKGRNGKNQPP